MVGANYMGGRRNAAKARTRDKSGKAQKEFFGRRRLNILSRGLGVQPRLMLGEEVITGAKTFGTLIARNSIDFNHAKKAESLLESDAHVSDSIKSSSSTPRKRTWDDISTFTTSSSCSRRSIKTKSSSLLKPTKSKLLQQLDVLEPFSANAAISCILAMPDLAGLAGLSSSRKRSRSKSPSPSPIDSDDEYQFSGGEDEIVDYFSRHGPESSVSSASASHEPTPLSGKRRLRASSILAPEQPRHFDDPTNFTQSASLDSDLDLVFPDDQSLGFEHRADAEFPGSTDWTFNNLSSSSLSFILGSRRDADTESSSKTVNPNEKPLLADDNNLLNERGSQNSSWLYTQKSSSTDTKMAAERERPNLLDYSDPWSRIGVVLGLQKDCLPKKNQTPQPTQKESDIQELLAAFEGDLPPSDMPLDDSLDDTLFTPSSLPIAESSEVEVTKVSSIPSIPDCASDHTRVFEEVKEAFGLSLGDVGHFGSDHLDDLCCDNLPNEILAFSDLAADPDMGTIKSPDLAGCATKAAHIVVNTNTILDARISSDNDSGPPQGGLAQFSGDGKINSIPAPLFIGRDDEASTQSYTLSIPATVPPNEERIELRQPSAGIPRNSGMFLTLQERSLLRNALEGDSHSIHIAEVTSQKGSVLAVPKLLECDGVYQGPCLLSDESEYSELEE